MTTKELAEEIKSAVEWLIETDEGCSTIKLDDRLAVCVGWSDGYDESDEYVIHAKNGPSWGINAGIRVWTSDYTRTDLDWINMPFYEDIEVWDDTCSIGPNEDYIKLAKFFLKDYETLSKFEINEDGLIISEGE